MTGAAAAALSLLLDHPALVLGTAAGVVGVALAVAAVADANLRLDAALPPGLPR